MYHVRIARMHRGRGMFGPSLRRWISRYTEGRRRERLVAALPFGPYEVQLLKRQ